MGAVWLRTTPPMRLLSFPISCEAVGRRMRVMRTFNEDNLFSQGQSKFKLGTLFVKIQGVQNVKLFFFLDFPKCIQ